MAPLGVEVIVEQPLVVGIADAERFDGLAAYGVPLGEPRQDLGIGP